MFLVVVAFLIVNKVYSPQYVIWLLPLAALARPRWRDLLIWQACEIFYFFAVWMHIADFFVAAWYAGLGRTRSRSCRSRSPDSSTSPASSSATSCRRGTTRSGPTDCPMTHSAVYSTRASTPSPLDRPFDEDEPDDA